MSDFNLKVGAKVDTSTIQKELNAKEYKVTATIVTKGGDAYEKTVRKLKDESGKLYETTELVNKSTKETTTQLTKATSTVAKATSTVKETSTAIQTASKHTKTLGQDFLSTAGKVAKFGAITAVIGLFTSATSEAVVGVKELDTSLTELKKVSDLSGAGLEAYTEDAFKMARDLSTTATNVTDATAQFVQAGYDLGESEGLSKYAIMLQSIADETMSTETATGFLTTTIKSMNMTVGDAEHLISAVNEVSNQYAITSNDLSENIGKVAGVADVAGVSYEQLLGLMTSAVSRGSTASKSANAFKSLFINLQQMNEKGTMPKLSEQFDEFGVSMIDTNGATKNAFQLLKELSVAYKEVSASTDVDKQNKMKTLIEDIGGKYNANVLINSLSGFDIALSATETALNSTGSAQREFDKSLDSINKKADAVKGAFLELVWGDGGLNSFIKGLLDAGTAVLKFADSDIGGFSIKVGLAIVSINLLSNGITTVGTKLAFAQAGMTEMAISTALASGANVGFLTSVEAITVALVENALAWAMTPMGMATITVVGITAIAVAINYANESLDKNVEKLEEVAQASNEADSEVASLTTSLESIQKQISDINNDKLSITDEKQLGLLEEQEASLKRQLAIAIQKAKVESEAEDNKARIALESKTKSDYAGDTETFSKMGIAYRSNESVSAQEELGLSIIKYQDLTREKLALVEAGKQIEAQQGTESQAFLDNATAIADVESEMEKVTSRGSEMAGTIDGISNSISDEKLSGVLGQLIDKWNEVSGATNDAENSINDTTVAIEDETDSAEESLSVEDARAQALSNSLDATNAIISSVDELSSAFQEEAENGEISVATQLKMIEDGYALALSYDATTGACTINKEAVIALMEAKIQEQIANLTLLRTDLATKMRNDASVALTSAGAFLALANAKGSALSNLTGGGSKADKTQLASYDAQIKVLQNSLKSVKNVGTGAFSGIAKSAGGAGKATSKATDAIKKQKEALEKLKSNYERAINYIKKKLDEDIDKLEEDKDKAVESVDAKIDALNKQRDAEEKYWDDKIDALDEQNDKLEDQIKLEQLLEDLALAKSKKVRVYREGEGYIYESDEGAISEAEKNLAEYNRKFALDKQIKELEKNRDDKLAIYDAQIKDLEEYQKSVEDSYDSQIDYLKKYKENFENMVDSYSDAQDKLLAEQLTGINFEKGNWDTRLGNLQTFIAQYNSILSQLDTFDDSALDGGGSDNGGGGSSNSSSGTQKATKPYTIFQILGSYKTSGQASSNIGRLNGDGMMSYGGAYIVYKKTNSEYDSSSKATSAISSMVASSKGRNKYGYKQFASGVASIDANQMAIVGDDPNKNQELVMGNRASGKLMNLAKGTRVVDNGNTRLLGGLLNTFSKSGFIDSTTGMTTANVNSSNSSQVIHIGTINLPNVSNAQSFADELRKLNFSNNMTQYSYSNA